MIIRVEGPALVLISQPDHAALARRMMDHWVTRGFPGHERRRSILLAIEAHDNGWREIDDAPIVGAGGGLLDFVAVPIAVRQAIWPRGVRRLAADPVAAALVAEHAIHIYRRFRGDPAWVQFFAAMERLRAELAGAAGLPLDLLARDYFFLRAADLMSLVFCNGWTEPQEIDGSVIRLEGDQLVVSPDPFDGRAVGLEVPARKLPNRPYHSAADAQALFLAAETTTIAGTARGSETA